MGRTKLNFGKLDWTNLLEMAAVGILLAGAFQCVPWGSNKGRRRFHRRRTRSTHSSRQRRITTKKRCSMSSDQTESKSSRRVTKPKTPRTALISCRDTKKCTVWLKSRTELLFCTSARRIGRRLYPSSTRVVRGISTPMQARKRFCLDELAGMKYRPFVFARSSWRRKRNITPQSTPSMPRKSSVMKGSTMVFIGRLLRANPRALSGRWWRQPLLRATPKAEMALRLRTAATTTTS